MLQKQMHQLDWLLVCGKAVLKIAYLRKTYFKVHYQRCRLRVHERPLSNIIYTERGPFAQGYCDIHAETSFRLDENLLCDAP